MHLLNRLFGLQLATRSKHFIDTMKIIAYRAWTSRDSKRNKVKKTCQECQNPRGRGACSR